MKQNHQNTTNLSRPAEMILNEESILQIENRLYQVRTFRANVDVVLSELLQFVPIYNDFLIYIDLLHALGQFMFPYIKRFIGQVHQYMCLTNEQVTDASCIRPGDILFTSDRNYFIVKNIIGTATSSTSADRISVELLHMINSGIMSRCISKDTFAFVPKDAAVQLLASNQNHNVAHKLRNVGYRIFWQSTSKHKMPHTTCNVFGLNIWPSHRKLSSDIRPGDFISFLYHGLYKKGIVIWKKNTPNHILVCNCFLLTKSGKVSEKETIIDLDLVRVTRYSYKDLDSVIRQRILYTANHMIGQHIEAGVFSRSMTFFLGCISGDIVYSRCLPIFIGLREIKLSTKAFPRIENIESWMTNKSCLKLPNEVVDTIKNFEFCPTVYFLMNDNGETEMPIFFDDSTVLESKNELFSSLYMGKLVMQQKCSKMQAKMEPSVLICMLNPDEDGSLSIQDKSLLHLVTMVRSDFIVDVIYIVPKKMANKGDIRLRVSINVQAQIDSRESCNTVYHSIFYDDDSDVQKRVSLFVERKVNDQIKLCLKNLILLQKEHPEMSIKSNGISNFASKISELTSFISQQEPDAYDRHKLEVILQRNPNISAFSLRGKIMQIFINQQEAIDQYIQQYIKENICTFEVKSWPGLPKVLHCHLKQGSKVCRSNVYDKLFGTLGFFVRDTEGNIYFTTCAHVISKDMEAFAETEDSAVGKSIYTPSTSCLSLTDSLDLSLVKVYQDKVEGCRFGLRNSEDILVQGTISVADKSEMYNMKLYKWGAKTNLTKGIYKGAVFVKKGEKFDSHIHYIQSSVKEQIFAEEGDSGSLICFEATGSPQFSGETGAFIFVGRLVQGAEYSSEGEEFAGICYHVSNIFDCGETQHIGEIKACLSPNTEIGEVQQGAGVNP